MMRCYNKLQDFEQSKAYAEKLVSLSNASPENKTEAQYCIGMAQYYTKSYDLALATFKLYQTITKATWVPKQNTSLPVFIIPKKTTMKPKPISWLSVQIIQTAIITLPSFILLSDVFVKTADEFQAKHTLESIIKNCEFEDLVAIAKQKLQNIIQFEEQKAKTDSLNVKPTVLK